MSEELFFQPSKAGDVILVFDFTGSMDYAIDIVAQTFEAYMKEEFGRSFRRAGLVWMEDHGKKNTGAFTRTGEMHPDEGSVHRHGGVPYKALGMTEDLHEFTSWLRDKPHPPTYWNPTVGADECWACAVDAARRMDKRSTIWLVADTWPHDFPVQIHPESTFMRHIANAPAHIGNESTRTLMPFPKGCPDGIKPDYRGVHLLHIDHWDQHRPEVPGHGAGASVEAEMTRRGATYHLATLIDLQAQLNKRGVTA